MIILLLGYLVMGIMFIVFRFFYHILPKKNSSGNLIFAVKNDFINLYSYVKQIILSYPKIIKTILALITMLFVLNFLPLQTEIKYAVEDALSIVLFFLMVIIFAPKDEPSQKGFPVEIFGFIYSVVLLFYSFGLLVFDICYMNNINKEDMWIYGYIVTMISYVICIATLNRFMEKDLSKEEIVLLGLIMMTTLEFITYYGIGFFSGMKWYDPTAYESNIFGDITVVINQGIYIASQSQILERTPMEVWGNIILNGTDVLSITAVLGYLVQKFTTK